MKIEDLPPGAKIEGYAWPVVKWQRPWEYAEWCVAVLRGRYTDEATLRPLYAQQWEPDACYEMMLFCQLFRKRPAPKRARSILELGTAQRRIAQAVFVETSKLLVRNLAADAREYVQKAHDNVRAQLGI